MELSAVIGIAAGICTSGASIPQIATTIKKKKASDVSPFMFFILFAGNSLWVWYGITKSDVPVMATNIISVTLDVVMLILRFKYQRKK